MEIAINVWTEIRDWACICVWVCERRQLFSEKWTKPTRPQPNKIKYKNVTIYPKTKRNNERKRHQQRLWWWWRRRHDDDDVMQMWARAEIMNSNGEWICVVFGGKRFVRIVCCYQLLLVFNCMCLFEFCNICIFFNSIFHCTHTHITHETVPHNNNNNNNVAMRPNAVCAFRNLARLKNFLNDSGVILDECVHGNETWIPLYAVSVIQYIKFTIVSHKIFRTCFLSFSCSL